MAKPVVVIESRFSVPHRVYLDLKKKDSCFCVLDICDSIVFQIVHAKSIFHERRILLDSVGNPVANLKQKICTTRQRWQVYRGNSKDEQDLLFSVIKPHEKQTKLHVFLASNTNEDVVDFRIEGSWSAGSFDIYGGKSSSNIVAQLPPKASAVTVDANIDYAFIVTLIVILYEIFEVEDASASVSELLDAFTTGFDVVQAILS